MRKFLALILTSLLLTGCGHLLRRTETVSAHVTDVAPATNTVIVVTNTVTILDRHSVTNWLTNVIEVVSPGYSLTNLVTNIVYTVAPAAEQTISTLRQVNDVVNPTPARPFIDVLLGGLAAGLGVLAKLKTNRARLVPALIAGVEASANPDVKAKIREIASAAGVERQLNRAVQEETR